MKVVHQETGKFDSENRSSMIQYDWGWGIDKLIQGSGWDGDEETLGASDIPL